MAIQEIVWRLLEVKVEFTVRPASAGTAVIDVIGLGKNMLTNAQLQVVSDLGFHMGPEGSFHLIADIDD